MPRAPRKPIRPPELSELEAFVLAADEGSIARAASKLRISAPAVGKRIRQLEVLAGEPMLARARRGVTLTETGARVYAPAQEILAYRARVIEALSGAGPAPSQRLPGLHQLLAVPASQATEKLLEDAESVLAAVFEGTSDAVLISRSDNGLIREANEGAARLLGFSVQELRGRRTFEVQVWDPSELRNELVDAAIATRQPQHGELSIRARNRPYQLVQARFEALDLQGTIYLITTIRTTAADPARP